MNDARPRDDRVLKAGAGRVDVSPREPMFLIGYPHVERISTGIHDPLYATALCLDDGERRTLAVVIDLLYAPGAFVDACRSRIHERTGLLPENVLISATHTHSGPVTGAILGMSADPVVPAPDPVYMEYLTASVVKAACEAVGNLAPAEIAVTTATVDGVGCNRIAPDAVRDPEAGIVAIRGAGGGDMLAVQMFYCMHPTVMHEDSTLISSDFPGYTRLRIEERYPGVSVLYHNGPCGNLSPRYHVKAQTFAEAERLGRRLGGFVIDALEALTDQDFAVEVAVDSARAYTTLQPRAYPSVEVAKAGLREARGNYTRLKRENAGHGPVRTAECVVFGAEELVTMSRAQADGTLIAVRKAHERAEVQVLRVGDTFIVGWPGELFVEYALDLKRRSSGRAFVASLANGELQGYITTPGAVGYEASLSMFEAESGAALIETALDLIKGFQ